MGLRSGPKRGRRYIARTSSLSLVIHAALNGTVFSGIGRTPPRVSNETSDASASELRPHGRDLVRRHAVIDRLQELTLDVLSRALVGIGRDLEVLERFENLRMQLRV